MKQLLSLIKSVFLVGAIALAGYAVSGTAAQQAKVIRAAPPCNYDVCPGGSSNCCTEGGVTLYRNLPTQ